MNSTTLLRLSKTVIYERKRFNFNYEQALNMSFLNQALRKYGSFLASQSNINMFPLSTSGISLNREHIVGWATSLGESAEGDGGF